MATGVKPYIVTSLLIFIFFLGIANWQVGLAQDNNSPQNILNDSTTSRVINGNNDFGQNYSDDTNITLTSYFKSGVVEGGDSLLVQATPGITQTLYRMPKAVFTIMTEYLGVKLLSDEQRIVTTVILCVFTGLFILYAVKFVKLGVPD